MKNGLWIPNEILQLETLNANDKIILSTIFSFAQGNKGSCIAYNTTIADAAKVKKSTVAHSIPRLIEDGYLKEVGSKKRRELRVDLEAIINAKIALDKCKNCTQQVQNLHSINAKIALPLNIYKEREEERLKREGEKAPPAEEKEEVFIHDEGRDGEDAERFLSDFWKQELSI